MWIFRPSKLHRRNYVETMWIFRPSKLHRRKYVETTWIFPPAKSHRKSTWKWRGNSLKFGLRRIDVISTSNRRGFDVVCPLGECYGNNLKITVQQTSLIVYKQEYSKQQLRTRHCSQSKAGWIIRCIQPSPCPLSPVSHKMKGDAHMRINTQIKFLYYSLLVSLFATKILENICS